MYEKSSFKNNLTGLLNFFFYCNYKVYIKIIFWKIHQKVGNLLQFLWTALFSDYWALFRPEPCLTGNTETFAPGHQVLWYLMKMIILEVEISTMLCLIWIYIKEHVLLIVRLIHYCLAGTIEAIRMQFGQ